MSSVDLIDVDSNSIVSIKDRPILHIDDSNMSDTLYISGFKSIVTDQYIISLLNKIDTPLEIELLYRKKTGRVWVKYHTIQAAGKTMLYLNQCNHNDQQLISIGCNLSIKYELGMKRDRQRVVSTNRNYHHSTIIRHIRTITNDIIESTHESTSVDYNTTTTDNHINKNNNMNTVKSLVKNKKSKSSNSILQCNLCMKGQSSSSSTSKHSGIMIPPSKVTYSSNSLLVNNMEYPFPTGIYLTRVIQLMQKVSSQEKKKKKDEKDGEDGEDPLLRLITDTSIFGNKYNKEISESMSMVDSVYRVIAFMNQTHSIQSTVLSDNKNNNNNDNDCIQRTIIDLEDKERVVNVFVLGDGMYPITAACMCLHLPEHWTFYSIDPLMEYNSNSVLG